MCRVLLLVVFVISLLYCGVHCQLAGLPKRPNLNPSLIDNPKGLIKNLASVIDPLSKQSALCPGGCPPINPGYSSTPQCFWGIDFTDELSLLGSFPPSLSIIENAGQSILTLSRSGSPFTTGSFPLAKTLSLQILRSSCSNHTASLFLGSNLVRRVASRSLVHLLPTGSMWCSASGGCTVNVTNVVLNGEQRLTDDIVVEGGMVKNVVYSNDNFESCSWNMTLNIRVECGDAFLARSASAKCRFEVERSCNSL